MPRGWIGDAIALTTGGQALVVAALLVLAIATGVLAGINPALGIGLAAAMTFAVIVIVDLAAGLALFVLLTYLDVVSGAQALSLTKFAGLLVGLSWLTVISVRGGPRERDILRRHPVLVALMAAFLCWVALSATWARSVPTVSTDVVRYGLNLLLIPIVYTAVRQRRHVTWLYAAFLGGVLLSALYGWMTGAISAGQVGRLGGARTDANSLATLLIVGAVLGSTLGLVARRTSLLRTLTFAGAGIATIAVFATLSRGGLLTLAAVVLAAIAYGGRWRVAPAALAVVVALAGAAFVGTAGLPAADRINSTNTSGRIDLWTIARRMVVDHPITGVGAGNFTQASVSYLVQPGVVETDEYIIDEPKVVHNMYLQVLAELGIVGLALFLGIIGACLRSAMQAVSLFRRLGDEGWEVLARGLVIALAGLLVSDLLLSGQFLKQLWILLPIGPTLLAFAEARARRMIAAAPSRAPRDLPDLIVR